MTNDRPHLTKPQRVTLPQQAQHYLRGLIDAGTYQPGDQLPSQKELAAQLGISRLTLREALLGLEQEGVIVLKQGVGTFVAPSPGDRLDSGLERLDSILELAAHQGLQVTFDDLHVSEEPAEPGVASDLHVAPGTLLTSVCRVIAVDGLPVAYMVDAAPGHVLSAADIGASFSGSVLELLRDRPDLRVAHAVSNITAISADEDVAGLLRVRPQQALLLLEETLFSEEGEPLEHSHNYFVPDYFRFHVIRR